MTPDKLSRFWLLVTFLLIMAILISSLIIWLRLDKGDPLVITPPQPRSFTGDISVTGAVANPGIYPVKSGDSLESILQASGGMDDNADLSRISIYVPTVDEDQQPQKVDINHADIWLLQSLPGIGETRARSIIEYRQINGFFRNIKQLTEVPGIGETTYESIKDLVTTGE